ncbi:TcpD family membrane protein [Calothrix sp. UHCC 0171]|uniref:TcpD family membrane protein n=1 Tax=Calothrix sp. UHCC 0171 TaxID=3110245 RepID=UPI002B21C198|nr:TcpD family membrane protein [Calothrix sp. UHCC 0171]MEA5569547.1 TcpD family membrane protein [Calothrix sp. UHCC 0171]
MSTNLIFLIAQLIVVWLIFKALLNVLNTVIGAAIAIFVIGIILVFFGFSPETLIQKISNLPQMLQQLVTDVRKFFGW